MGYAAKIKKTGKKAIGVQPDVGIKMKTREEVASMLSSLLADTYFVYLKTQNYHWNVQGPRFVTLHKLFEEQYRELAQAIDSLAERVRFLGFRSPGSFIEFRKLSQIQEEVSIVTAEAMIEYLLADHETIAQNIREVVAVVQETGDSGTEDLLVQQLRWHEKNTWLLRSHFGELAPVVQ